MPGSLKTSTTAWPNIAATLVLHAQNARLDSRQCQCQRQCPPPRAGAQRHPKRHDPATDSGSGGVAIAGAGGGGVQDSGGDVKGILIGAPVAALQPGAPGLHSAGANQTSWPAVGIAGVLLLSVLVGMRIELRRPEVIL